MKSKLLSFLSGMVVMLMLVGLPVTALAASGALTIEVNPIKVLVNGEVFQPKDVNGNDVMVFTYNGTTYAPLRALAEAYGLEVGYDARNNIATVDKPTTPFMATGRTRRTSITGCWTRKRRRWYAVSSNSAPTDMAPSRSPTSCGTTRWSDRRCIWPNGVRVHRRTART